MPAYPDRTPRPRPGTYTKKLTDQLMELVFLVQGDLIVRERINLGALITIELHGRDVMDNMYAAEVCVTCGYLHVFHQ